MRKKFRRTGEFELIAELFAPLATAKGALGLKDDAAWLRPSSGQDLVVTADALVEGVHFFRTDPPATIAKKALRVNLSDLAAKGAAPRFYLLALSLPAWADDGWLKNFAGGLAADQKRFGVSLIGGDTTSTPGPLTLAITAFGYVRQGTMIKRSGARVGDLVYVTGTIGDAGAGLAVLKGEGAHLAPAKRNRLITRYRLPDPRVTFGPRLTAIAHAAIDVSDGLIADLGHIAATSGKQIVLDAARIPLSPAICALWGHDRHAIVRAATSGDDYEIAFTAGAEAHNRLAVLAERTDVAVTAIGRVERGAGVVLLDAGKAIPIAKAGFVHR